MAETRRSESVSADDELRALAKRYIDAGDHARAMSLLALLADRDVKPGKVIELDARRRGAR